ncbi:restriction endonuclease subunit S (plasmid) [Cetobacterium somerae]|uniref:restriction endonuclease subunit S n=1 Tax=Cetobacterium somerae TaxID=188913 RepID=UPI002602A48B|nr:restriction endonuclease subunit S [Cetobacterium somerae]WVJ03434.1 restriction endonuclease subunit S [Cetobacterium somerae]
MKNKVPKLRFPEFSGEWEEKKLEEICDKSIEKNKQNIIKTVFSNSAKYGIVLQNDFFDREITTEANQDNYYIVKPDSFVYNPRISQSAPVGPVSINKTGLIGIVSPLYTIFNLKENSFVNKEYLEIYFMTNKWHGYLKSVANTGARHDRMNITDSQLFKLPISISNSTEQEKIASFLSKVDESIEILEEEKELWEKYKKGMMQKIFSQKLRFKDENGNDYPEWEEKKFKDIYTFKSTNSLSRDKLNYENGEIKNIHYGDIHTKFKTLFDITKEEVPFINLDVSFNKITLENYCKKGDLIIADASEDYADIGKCIEIINSDNQKILAGLHTFVARPTFLKVATGFGGYLMKSPSVYKQIRIIAQGTKVLSLSATRVADLDLYIPSLPEQEKIANFLSSIDEKIELIEKELEVVKEFKKGLLQQMFI